MSLAVSHRVHKRQLIELKDTGKLIIPDEIIEKIHFLHSKIKSIEWSAILVYEIVSGEVEKPKDLVLKVKDFILMDIGNAAYTEYEFSVEDAYSFDKYTAALEAGYKIGHLHTHHSMNCFFSGTDMDELYDNSEKHNFYLSLIVNFKNINEWCAAIAMCLDETITGEIKETGNIKVSRTYKGKDGLTTIDTNKEINEVKPFNTTKSMMYKINLNLERENETKYDYTELEDRIEEVKKSKLPKYNYAYTQREFDWDDTSRGGTSINTTFQKINKEAEKTEKEIQSKEEVLDSDGQPIVTRKKLCYSPKNVLQPLITMLEGSENMGLFATLVNFAEDCRSATGMLEYNIGTIEERFPQKCDNLFNIIGEDLDYHCIAVSCTHLLQEYKDKSSVAEVVKLLLDVLDIYILNEKEVSNAMTSHFTGLQFVEDNDIDEELLKNY